MTIQNEIFRMSMEAREKQKQKTQARHDQGIRRSTNNIMNTKTDNTGLFGANTNPFQTNLYKDTKKQMERNERIERLKKKSDFMFSNMTDEDQIELDNKF